MPKTEKEFAEERRKEAQRQFQMWYDKMVWEVLTGAKEVQEARTKADGGS